MREIFKRILVPYDFSEGAAAALEVAAALATRHRGSLTVIHVLAPVVPVGAFAGAGELPLLVSPDDVRGPTRKRLLADVARIVGRRVPRVTCKLVLGDPSDCIVQAARRADAIVMATLGRTGIAHLVIGSVAEKVVRHSSVPVLTLRPAASRAALGKARPRPRARR